MADKKLGVEIDVESNVDASTNKIANSVKKAAAGIKTLPSVAAKAGAALKTMSERGAKAFESLTQKAFFFKEMLGTVANVARGLWNAFIAPAKAAETTEVALANLTGSTSQAAQMMDQMRGMAKQTGVDLGELYSNAVNLAETFAQTGQKLTPAAFQSYLASIEKVSKLRPDLSAAEQIGIVNEIMAGNLEAAAGALGTSEEKLKKVAQQAITMTEVGLGAFTSVVRKKGEDAGAALEEMGVSAQAVEKTLDILDIVPVSAAKGATALNQLKAAWDVFRESVGAKVLDLLAEKLTGLVQWLTDNEDQVVALATAVADNLVTAVQAFFEWLTPERLDAIVTGFTSIVTQVGELISAFLSMPDWVKALLVGGAAALGPLGGGKALLGAAGSGIGKLLGGSAAAAGTGGAGTAAAGAGTAASAGTATSAGTVAAGAGGLSAAGVAAAGLGGVALGVGVNELIARSDFGKQIGAQTTGKFATTAAYGLGNLFGGKEKGLEWAGKTGEFFGEIPKGTTEQMRQGQQVQVQVGIDPKNGSVTAYVADQVEGNNATMAAAMSGA